MGIVNSLINELLNGEEKVISYPPRSQNGPEQISHTPTVTVNHDIASSKKTAVKKPAPNKVETTTKTVPDVTDKNPLNFELTSNQMVRGIILSEIIGKPVSKRHGYGSTGSYKIR